MEAGEPIGFRGDETGKGAFAPRLSARRTAAEKYRYWRRESLDFQWSEKRRRSICSFSSCNVPGGDRIGMPVPGAALCVCPAAVLTRLPGDMFAEPRSVCVPAGTGRRNLQSRTQCVDDSGPGERRGSGGAELPPACARRIPGERGLRSDRGVSASGGVDIEVKELLGFQRDEKRRGSKRSLSSWNAAMEYGRRKDKLLELCSVCARRTPGGEACKAAPNACTIAAPANTGEAGVRNCTRYVPGGRRESGFAELHLGVAGALSAPPGGAGRR